MKTIASVEPPAGHLDLQNMGLGQTAYVRLLPDDLREQLGAPWGIFAADGSVIGATTDRKLAFAAIRQHGLGPVDAN